jgi:ankyrin repeat protein
MIGKRKKQNRVQIDPASTEHLNPKDSEETLRNIIENEGGEGLDHWIRRHPYEMAVRYPSGLTPLLIAAKESSPDSALASVEKILAAPNIDVNAKDKTGRTALHTASLRGLVDVAARLLKSKAQIDACDHESMTALHLAVMERCTSIVKLLIDNNANPNATTARRDQATTPMKSGQAPGLTPLHIAAFRGYKEIMKILLNAKHINVSPRDYGSGLTPLHEACRGCNSECASNDEKVHADVASLLIDYGADVNATTEEKFTPLHMASLVGRTSVVKVLMDAGADPSRYTSQMANAESLAPENVREQIAKILHHRHRGSISRPPPEARLEIAQPRPDQEGTCKDFKGFIWPALNGVRTFSPCAIWDMLYRPQPLLSNRHEKAIWIHLPSNNVRFPCFYACIGRRLTRCREFGLRYAKLVRRRTGQY